MQHSGHKEAYIMGGDPLNPDYLQRQLPVGEAHAALRIGEDALNDLEAERNALRVEVGKALSDRDRAWENAERMHEAFEALRQQSAETQHIGAAVQDRLTASFQQPLAEIERHARQVIDEAAAQAMAKLERERDTLKRDAEIAHAKYLDANATSEAAREARNALQEELATIRQELKHRVDEVNLLKERCVRMVLGLNTLKEAGQAQDGLIESLKAGITAPSSLSTVSQPSLNSYPGIKFDMMLKTVSKPIMRLLSMGKSNSARAAASRMNDAVIRTVEFGWPLKMAVLFLLAVVLALWAVFLSREAKANSTSVH